jgi:hypothetical protein
MRFLTVKECEAFDGPGGQNEVTPVQDKEGKVIAVYVYTRHASGSRTEHLRPHGHKTYGNLVAAADARATASAS